MRISHGPPRVIAPIQPAVAADTDRILSTAEVEHTPVTVPPVTAQAALTTHGPRRAIVLARPPAVVWLTDRVLRLAEVVLTTVVEVPAVTAEAAPSTHGPRRPIVLARPRPPAVVRHTDRALPMLMAVVLMVLAALAATAEVAPPTHGPHRPIIVDRPSAQEPTNASKRLRRSSPLGHANQRT